MIVSFSLEFFQKYPLVDSFESLFMFMCIARNPKRNNINISLLFWSNAGKNVASKKLGPNFFLLTMTADRLTADSQ